MEKAKPGSSFTPPRAFVRELDSGAYEALAYVDGEEFSLGAYLDEGHAQLACQWANLKMFGDVTSSTTIAEKIVQEFYTTEQVLRMTRDNRYHAELKLFERRNAAELFRKRLTMFDVCGEDGLRVKKKDAEQHFGSRSLDRLEFFDWDDKLWVFKYSALENGRRFISAEGWNEFLISKNLQIGDDVVFFQCSGRNRRGSCGPYRMIGFVKSKKRSSQRATEN